MFSIGTIDLYSHKLYNITVL